MNKERTPLPWIVQGVGGIHMDGLRDGYTVLGPNGQRLQMPHLSKVDAEFIVKACNSYDALVDACKVALLCLPDPDRPADVVGYPNPFAVAKVIKDALAKAGEG